MGCRLRPYTAAGAAAGSVAAVLALAGCGGGGNDASPAPTTSGTATTTATATAGTAGGGGPSGHPTASGTATASTPTASADGTTLHGVEGVWLATEGGSKVQLVLGKGEAGLTSTSLCGGSYTDKNGIGLTLTCMDGNKTRTSGHGVLASDGQTLTVQWTGGLTDTFARTDLPSS